MYLSLLLNLHLQNACCLCTHLLCKTIHKCIFCYRDLCVASQVSPLFTASHVNASPPPEV